MELLSQPFTFRLRWRGKAGEYGGRILDAYGEYTLQVWMNSPEHSQILLEAGPVDDEDALWPLFLTLCEHRGVEALEMRRGREAWQPIG